MTGKAIVYAKLAAFEHEMNNEIDLIDIAYQDTKYLAVKEYFEERIREMKEELKKS